MNLLDVTKYLQTDDQCLDFLEKVRWNGRVRCIRCGNDKISRVERKANPSDKKKKNRRSRLYTCLESTCKHQFSTTTGTMFHDSHLPLSKWFMAIALIVHAKKGMSAKQMERHLDVNYRTAWFMGHRIRKAMAQPGGLAAGMVTPRPKMSGIVEMDETYVGGRQRGKGVKYGKEQKAVVVGLRERGGDLRFFHTSDARAVTLKPILDENISSEVEQIMTDDTCAAYALLHATGKHSVVKHSRSQYVNGIVHTNSIESAFSLFKRGVVGSFHRVSHKHLHRYLSEFEYRFNGRELPDLFGQTVARMTQPGNMPYAQLIS
ncbi:MAG: IS1595 family transposase [Candidatus Sulfotelmatobacter sp.]